MTHSENMNGELTPGKVLELIDGARGDVFKVSEELEPLRAIVANSSNTLEEKLEAYEDIVDSEVGDTSLLRARNLERELGIRQLYLKFEGSNPSGTQKDRIAFSQAMDALRRGFDSMTVATCGNYGVAVALAAYLAGLRCLIYIPDTYHTSRIKEMTKLGAEIIRTSGDYETSVEISRRYAEEHECYDANPGGNNTALQLSSYGQIAYEIYDELRDAPLIVAAPVSNGTTLAGIYKGFVSLYRRGKTSRIPRIVAGSSFRKNPIIQAYLKNLPFCSDLQANRIRETKINEPLINWHSIDGDYVLDAMRETAGWARDASDKKMASIARMIRQKEGLNVVPASTAGLIALIEQHQKEPFQKDRFVVILTGRR